VDGSVAVILGPRVAPLDVVALAADLPPLRLVEAGGNIEDLPLGWEDRADTADVLHLAERHRRFTLELVEDRRQTLQALRDLRHRADLADVVPQTRIHPRERSGMQAAPLVDHHQCIDQLRAEASHRRLVASIHRRAELTDQLARAIDLLAR
jgi:hypothetical protein